MDHIAITGASGFIGQHVLLELLKIPNLRITAITRDLNRLQPIAKAYRQLKVHQFDIGCLDAQSYVMLDRPQALVHLAWDGLPNYTADHHFSEQLPLQYRFIKHMIYGGLPHLVVAGTCFEYGMQSGCLEESMACFPSNAYGLAKYSLYQQLTFLQEVRPYTLAWARLFYTYGSGQAPSALYSQLIQAIDQRDKVFNMSPGQQVRDFLPISTVASILVELATRPSPVGVVNICSNKPITVREFAEKIIDQHQAKLKLNLGYYPYPMYEPLSFWGNNAKLNSLSLI